LHDPRFVCEDHGSDPIPHAELAEHRADVALHRVLADEETLGDLGVREPKRATPSR